MRTVLVYLLAMAALAAAAILGYPELFSTSAAGAKSEAGAPPRPTPVVVGVVRMAPFIDSLDALGTVHANESVAIVANRADQVAAIHFTDGQQVAAGDLLLEMNSDEERALLAEAQAIRDERELSCKRATELYDQQLIALRERDAAQAQLAAAQARVIGLEAAIADREVRAPFAGTLGLRRVSVGAYLQSSTVITTLDDLTVVKLDFTIPETWLATIRPGMKIVARSDTWPGVEFPGEVTMIDTRLETSTRSATVRALVPNPDQALRPGMLLKVVVQRGEAPTLQVAEEALIPVAAQQFVLVVDANNHAHRVPVVIGRRRVGVVEVLEGVSEGDRVVVEGVARVRDDGPVDVVATVSPDS